MVLEQLASGRAPDFLITAREAFRIDSEAEAHTWAMGGPDGIRALRRGVLPETIGTPDQISLTADPALARVDAGWWIADCPNPRCNSAMALVRGARGFLCADCFNADIGRLYRALVWPEAAEIRAIERELLKRPELLFMHWRPGVTVAELAEAGPFHHSWTAPKTYTVGAVGTAAERNTYERDNLLETAPAKFTTAEDLFVATAANAGKRLAKGTDGFLLTMVAGAIAWVAHATPGKVATPLTDADGNIQASSTTWVTAADVTISPSLAGGNVLVMGGGSMKHSNAADVGSVRITDGTTAVQLVSSTAAEANDFKGLWGARLYTSVGASTQFELQVQRTSGSGLIDLNAAGIVALEVDL